MPATADFELGVNGNNILTSDPGSASKWDATLFSTTLIYDNTHVAHGNLAMKSNSKVVGWNSTTLGTMSDHYGRIYIWKPDAGEFFRVLTGGINGSQLLTLSLSASGFINALDLSGTAFTGSLDYRSKWVRVEYHVIQSATVGQVFVNTYVLDNTSPLETLSTAANRNTGASADTCRYGSPSAVDIWMDDIIANATAFPGPIFFPIPPITRATSAVGKFR